MKPELVDNIVNTVLYEGYILYPYRASSMKNQRQRFTFGRVYPRDYSEAQEGREPYLMQTECLVRNESHDVVLHIGVRFLQPIAREVGVLDSPIANLPDEEPPIEIVPELCVDGTIYQTWQEAMERLVELPPISLNVASKLAHKFQFDATRALEPICNDAKQIAGVLLRRCEALEGTVELKVQPIDRVVFKITARILNVTPVPRSDLEDQKAVISRSFTSTHTILHAAGGEFISSLDPPAQYSSAVSECRNIGTWPVLVGDEKKNERDAVLSSPIILYDYPRIAPESAGDLHDGTEIDEILTLRVQTMTEAEKGEMLQVDERARRILQRTESLKGDDLLRMHGAMREIGALSEDFFNPAARLKSCIVGGVTLKAGDRVRIRPRKRADVMDIALAGKIAIIEAVEQDVEHEVHLALVLEDDPGRELGMMRQPGHRFFYGADEVEPIRE